MVSNTILYLASLLIAIQCVTVASISSRSSWGAQRPRSVHRVGGVNCVTVDDEGGSRSYACSNRLACQRKIRDMQSEHMGHRLDDIGYNFLVGNDGVVYEGRGFGVESQSFSGAKSRCIRILFLGHLPHRMPSRSMLRNGENLISQAISGGHLTEDYSVACGRARSRLCDEVRTWQQ